MTTFNPQEAERLAERCERWSKLTVPYPYWKDAASDGGKAAAMLRAAIERVREERGYVKTLLQQADEAMERAAAAEKRVRELEDERDEMAPIISRAYELEHRIAEAEKVIEAAREIMDTRHSQRKGSRLCGACGRTWPCDQHLLAQALQEYDHG